MGRIKGVRLSRKQILHSRKIGRDGGLKRAANMTPEQRRASALKASKAAAKARKRDASIAVGGGHSNGQAE
jgi:hypothetical protein